jgi:hypothetical protein
VTIIGVGSGVGVGVLVGVTKVGIGVGRTDSGVVSAGAQPPKINKSTNKE